MDLQQFMRTIEVGDAPPRAPRVLLYVPPYGRPVHCPDLESAQSAAILYAAEHPGHTVAIYELAGYAHQPVVTPAFTAASSDKAQSELLDCKPEPDVNSNEPPEGHAGVDADRPHLTPAQNAQLRAMRDIVRGEDEAS